MRVALPELDVSDLLDLDDAVPGEDPSGVALVAVLADRRLHHVGNVIELGVLAQDVDQHRGLSGGGGRRLPDHRRVPRNQLLQALDQLVPENKIVFSPSKLLVLFFTVNPEMHYKDIRWTYFAKQQPSRQKFLAT